MVMRGVFFQCEKDWQILKYTLKTSFKLIQVHVIQYKYLETKTEEKVEIKSETAPSSGEPAVEAAVETS